MKFRYFGLCIATLCFQFSNLHADAVIVKAGRGSQLFRISNPPEDHLKVGDELCVVRSRYIIACGIAFHVAPKFAILKLMRPASNVVVGDVVALRKSAMDRAKAGAGGQTDSALKKLKVGFQLGLNLASASASPEPTQPYTNRVGLILGGAAVLPLTDIFGFETGLYYIEKGPKQASGSAELISRFDYIELPLLFKATLFPGKIRPYALLGPKIGFLIQAVQDTIQAGETLSRDDVKNSLSGIDFAFSMGAGAEYSLSPTMDILFSFRYALGLSNILSNSSGNASFANRGFEIVTGMLFLI